MNNVFFFISKEDSNISLFLNIAFFDKLQHYKIYKCLQFNRSSKNTHKATQSCKNAQDTKHARFTLTYLSWIFSSMKSPKAAIYHQLFIMFIGWYYEKEMRIEAQFLSHFFIMMMSYDDCLDHITPQTWNQYWWC